LEEAVTTVMQMAPDADWDANGTLLSTNQGPST